MTSLLEGYEDDSIILTSKVRGLRCILHTKVTEGKILSYISIYENYFDLHNRKEILRSVDIKEIEDKWKEIQ